MVFCQQASYRLYMTSYSNIIVDEINKTGRYVLLFFVFCHQ
ncbi:hypothetical protein EHW99_0368 [Erwinia amylovora]|uniref:Uncharacterized protein n=3 Tax=Erwinia amylovora TaxID=552 RepID=A0A831ESH5_ERWAM|nr:hypothetical protein EaACW_3271 [Erwinia amylovora ACW56400]QJQ53075.1 hypothetical protein EHX00_0368 [Erwinia amylovora]CBA23302.1 hypothetical protein predicted by Glimmer/Critica [Erwinia amylovora CFBP1430]CBX82133.1 hypothetical protein predicted by Glimmer/Critica [Erwinia amylovora ATCC BAA-2158]CCO80110.1 hypothetical protein BN432_3340 [Erwinia amylovora Ea356]CCO83914.1 hypothetical protein BN433_3366 [Erwinia amylovora Ea266]CCO87676.1 hypothetical protein BN434_3316 [Erwinia a